MQYSKELDDYIGRLAYRYAANSRIEPEDLKQLAIEKFLRCLDTLEDSEKLKSWLGRLIKNQFLNMQRDQILRATREQESAKEMPTLLNRTSDLLLLDIIIEAMAAIAEEYQIVLRMKFFGEFTIQEIASKLNIPEGTVASRLGRGRDILREQLRRKLGEDCYGNNKS